MHFTHLPACPPPALPLPACRALVPVLHASDVGTQKGMRKYKEGQRVAGKVLTVDAGGRGCRRQGPGARACLLRRRQSAQQASAALPGDLHAAPTAALPRPRPQPPRR